MIRDRARIAGKLQRIQRFIENSENGPEKWVAIYAIDRLRRQALYSPEWNWSGFKTEVEWARAYGGLV
jgi:hypothetical protein